MKTKIISILALLLTAAQGAWAQTELTKTGDKVWTLTTMPTYDIMLQAEYYTDLADNVVIDYSNVDGEDLTSGTHDIYLVRTLKAGSYNTFASPVAIDATGVSALGITELKELTNATLADGTLTLTFSTAETIEAGKPYLVKVSADKEVGGFDGATLTTTGTPATFSDVVSFIPTLGKTQVTTAKERILFLGASNTLLHPSADNQYINGFRAYFELAAAVQANAFVMDFDNNEVVTGIISLTPASSPKGEGSIYTIDGRKLQGQPVQKGVYINNGKKVVIK